MPNRLPIQDNLCTNPANHKNHLCELVKHDLTRIEGSFAGSSRDDRAQDIIRDRLSRARQELTEEIIQADDMNGRAAHTEPGENADDLYPLRIMVHHGHRL